MWVILGCLGLCDLDEQRAHGWSSEFALHHEGSIYGWHLDPYLGRNSEIATQRFSDQRSCLHALRRAVPERDTESHGEADDSWGYLHVTHYPDYVERLEGGGLMQGAGMNEQYYLACFQEAPVVG